MPICKLSTLLACTLTISHLHAQSSLVVTLASIRDRVHAQNPELAAARLHIAEARGRANQSGRLANPELESSIQQNPHFNEGNFTVEISQKFPLTQRLQLEKDISQTELQAAEIEVDHLARRISSEASTTLIEILAIHHRRELLEKRVELNRELAESLALAAAKGEGSPLDAGQARVETIRTTTAIRQLDATEAAAIGKLKSLLGMRANENLTVSGKLPAATLPHHSPTPELRPDYRAAKLETLAATQMLALEQARRIDDVEAGFFTGIERTEDAPDGRSSQGIIGLRFKIAWPFWNKNEGKIEEAQARQTRKHLETNALGRSIELEAETTLAEMRQWAALANEITTQLLPLTAEQVQKTDAAYQAAQTDLASVLRAREQHLLLADSHLDALREFHLARVRHSAATGQP